jgi:hypothetical protein
MKRLSLVLLLGGAVAGGIVLTGGAVQGAIAQPVANAQPSTRYGGMGAGMMGAWEQAATTARALTINQAQHRSIPRPVLINAAESPGLHPTASWRRPLISHLCVPQSSDEVPLGCPRMGWAMTAVQHRGVNRHYGGIAVRCRIAMRRGNGVPRYISTTRN